ncbi:MAG: tRNA epoxyqueuosine(34) reductase QueG [Porphyromonadaceae bacterium]|nr:MAG: tRNA epoxyqueuosine(34) reductase QueG [Porphyromonadaceae bacterium]
MPESIEIARLIEQKAFDLGFSACGFAPADSFKEFETEYRKWLSSGKAGEMNYLARNVDVRLDPGKLVEGAKTIISLAAGYYFPLPQHTPGNPRISRYALGEDYHQVLKSLGKELLDWIQKEIGPVNGRIFTDSAPVFEREWARRAGIGWIGKNGCLIMPSQGSWFFLAEIVIGSEIRSETMVVPDRCGNCTSCIEACPTRALAGDGSMDPRKCISYLTIEHRSDIPDEFHGQWQDWIFGCDICQDVCPWNNKPKKSSINELQPRPGLSEIDRNFFRNQNASSFGQIFDGTPVVRAGWSGILRNFEFLEKDGSQFYNLIN